MKSTTEVMSEQSPTIAVMSKVTERELSETVFAVLDLETSGGSPRLGAGITEIGVVKVKGGEVIATFQSFVDPGHSLPHFITELTGITDEMLISAPFIDEILRTLFEFLGSPDETVVVAHNSPFDLSFLKAAALTHEIDWPEYQTVDTARLARAVLDRDEVINCKLSTLAQFFGAETSPNHRALDDAKATVDVLHGLIERLAGFNIHNFEQMRNFPSRKKRAKRSIAE
jgi:DNA polymerase III epsilon subunit family exonuclease